MGHEYVIGIDPACGPDHSAWCLAKLKPDGTMRIVAQGFGKAPSRKKQERLVKQETK